MLRSIQIKNFRLFRDVSIDSLNRVNLIAGENNTGKTALLEALVLLLGDSEAFLRLASTLRAAQDAENDFESFWKWLFHQRDSRIPMEIRAIPEAGALFSLKSEHRSIDQRIDFHCGREGDREAIKMIRRDGAGGAKSPTDGWPRLSIFSTIPASPTEDAEYFNRIAAKRGGEQRVVELLQVIEPRLQDLKYLKLGSQPLVYADVGMEDLIPTTQLGQGFTRLLRLFSEILAAKSEVVLIDEIENGIHYTAMPKVWKGIAKIAREEDLQFFATTHSYECIRYAHEAFSSEPTYDLALHRLERDDAGNVRVVSLDRESINTSLDLEWEVR